MDIQKYITTSKLETNAKVIDAALNVQQVIPKEKGVPLRDQLVKSQEESHIIVW